MSVSPIIQRYLLHATLNAQNAPAGASGTFTVVSAPVPLGSAWTIRVRSVYGVIAPEDASGSIQVQSCEAAWRWFNAAGVGLFEIPATSSIIAPPANLVKAAGSNFWWGGDPHQAVSNFDITGGTAITVGAACVWLLTNTDATNPHLADLQIFAVLEFEGPGEGD